MKKNLLLLIFAGLYCCSGYSQKLYSNTTYSGDLFNPGLGTSRTPKVLFDDVLIPASLVQGSDSVNITKVNFGIVRLANAPATTVDFYYTVRDDTSTTISQAITIPPVYLGSIDLPENGNDTIASIITLGDSINTLFKVKTDTGGTFTGYQTLFLGLSFSGDDPESLNNWPFTTPGTPESNNVNYVWLYDVDKENPRSGGNFGTPPAAPSATFYLEVFGAGEMPPPLPVTLNDFNARRTGKINVLSWKTQQELNTRAFAVERSNDGRSYSVIGQVPAAGNTNTVRSYNFTDNSPVKGNNYYRLRSIDKDNSFKLSAIRSIRNEGLADVSIYPNPVINNLNIEINADEATLAQLTVSDVNGKFVYSKSLKLPKGNTILPVALNNIAAGTYFMKIQLNDDVIVKKFSKQ